MMVRTRAILIALLALQAAPALAQTTRPKPRPILAPSALAPSAVAPSTINPAEPVPTSPALQPEEVPAADPAASGVDATASADAAPAEPVQDPNRGSVTNLPLPRYVSLKTGEGNARRGPGLSHRIDWVFTHAGMPLRITAEYEHWRRVEDSDGLGGWVHYSLLSGVRTALVAIPEANFYGYASTDASVLFKAEAGVVAKIIECAKDWCRLGVEGEKGWVPITSIWGVDPGEIIE